MKIKQIVFCSLLLLFGANTSATSVYDNFSSNLSFDLGAGHGVGSHSDTEIGMVFSPTQSGFLDNVYVAASNYDGEGNIEFSLYVDESGKPGSVLEIFNLTNLVDYQTAFPAQKLESNSNTFLELEESYWLIASQPIIPDTAIWHYSGIAGESVVALRDNGIITDWLVTSHEMQFALQVNVTSVPLPSSIILFISAIASFVPLWFRNNKR